MVHLNTNMSHFTELPSQTLDASAIEKQKTTLRENSPSPPITDKFNMVELTPLLVLNIFESNCFESGTQFKILPGGLMKTNR